MATKFGVNQLSNPTPTWMKYIQRGILYISTLWAFLAPTFTNISPELLAEINMWLLRGNGILSVTTKFFGWSDTNKPDTDNP